MREKRKIFLSQREFWNQVKERERERELEKERENGAPWNVLNEGEKENKRRGVEIVDTCVEEKNKKKKRKKMKLIVESEMKKGKII